MNTMFWRNLSRAHIPGLDGVRAIAVMLVIFYHFGFPYIPGGHGIILFFVLSGFLITWLLLKEQESSGTISLISFYKRRLLRIFPAFYFYWLCLVSLLIIRDKQILWPHAWSSLFYLSNYYNAINGDPNTGFSHTWSLAIEEQFYLLWPFLFLLFKANHKKMSLLLAAIIFGVWTHRIVLYSVFGVDQAYFYAAFDTRLDALMVGCLLAVLLKNYSHYRIWQAMSERSWYMAVTITIQLASIFIGDRIFSRYRDVIGFALDPLLVSVLLIQIIGMIDKWPLKWLESRGMKFLGKISYSLYLYQQLTVFSVQKLLALYHPVVQVSAAVFVTVAVASASYYIIERPFLRLKN